MLRIPSGLKDLKLRTILCAAEQTQAEMHKHKHGCCMLDASIQVSRSTQVARGSAASAPRPQRLPNACRHAPCADLSTYFSMLLQTPLLGRRLIEARSGEKMVLKTKLTQAAAKRAHGTSMRHLPCGPGIGHQAEPRVLRCRITLCLVTLLVTSEKRLRHPIIQGGLQAQTSWRDVEPISTS